MELMTRINGRAKRNEAAKEEKLDTISLFFKDITRVYNL